MLDVFVGLLLFGVFAFMFGMIKPSIVIRWKEKATRKDVLKVYTLLIVSSFIGIGIFSKPLTPEQKEKIAIEKQAQREQEVEEERLEKIEKAKREKELEQKEKIEQEKLAIEKQKQIQQELEKERKRKIAEQKETKNRQLKMKQKRKANIQYALSILNTIYGDIERKGKHLIDMANMLESSDALSILEKANQYNYYAKKWSIKHYLKPKDLGAEEDDDIDKIISEVAYLAVSHQIYYASIAEYVDNQIPSKLLAIKSSLMPITAYKNNIIIITISLSKKYNLKYNEKKNIWHEIKSNN